LNARSVSSLVTFAVLASACWSLTTDIGDLTSRNKLPSEPLDGDIPTDAGGEGGPQSPAEAGTSFCNGIDAAVTLCDDFDQGDFGAKWTGGKFEESGGVIARDDTNVRTAPYSFLATTPAGATDPAAKLLHRAPGKPARVHVSFELRIEPHADTAQLLCGVLLNVGAGIYYRVDLAWQGAGFRVFESRNDGPAGTTLGSGAHLFEEWGHIELDLTFTGSPHVKVVARFKDQPPDVTVIDEPISPPEPWDAQTQLELGLYTGPPFPTPVKSAFRFDNVVYEFTPH
jgi:hypothetical protein